MDIHYNAFISYRHHPEDIRVASEIHRLLERFRIPKGLKSKVGKIERIFRDKDELPITSNLTEDITAALRNSDFLIVICSVHTKESVWVQREIETFLQTHSRSQVLTVLCSGEPYDVIPEILLREQVTDPVTGEKTWTEVEPLSCDWRLPAKQARREELPRLAAALLGCGYDALRQRQRQYRMRRLMAAMSVVLALSLGFAGYFLYTSIQIQKANVQIQANLDEARRNQSRFLANAAQERLDAGDRLTAIALAMEALPDYSGERPYVPEAEYVLSNALGVYEQADIAAVGAIGKSDNTLMGEFWLSEYAPLALLRDDRGVLTTWNTETMEKIARLPVEERSVGDALFTRGGNVVVRLSTSESAVCAMTSEGVLLWKKENCWDMDVFPDGTLILLCIQEGQYTLEYIDPETGSGVRPEVDITIPDSTKQPGVIRAIGGDADSPVALSCWDFDGTDLFVMMPGAEHPVILAKGLEAVYDMLITEDGKLVTVVPRDQWSYVGTVLTRRTTGAVEYDIFCYDLADGEQLWTAPLLTYSFAGVAMLRQIPQTETALCISGDTLQILDLNSGEILKRCEAGNDILWAKVEQDRSLLVLRDGYYCVYYHDGNTCSGMPYMAEDLSQAQLKSGDGLYGLQQDSLQVNIYRWVDSDRVWEIPLGGYGYVDDARRWENRMCFVNDNALHLVDLTSQETLWTQDVGYATVLDFSGDGSRIWAIKGSSELLTCFTEDGRITTSELFREWEGDVYYPTYGTGTVLRNDCLYYLVNNREEARLACWDLLGNGSKMLPLSGAAISRECVAERKAELLACTDEYAWIWAEQKGMYVVALQDGTVTPVKENLRQKPKVIYADAQRILLSEGDSVHGFTGTQKVLALSLEDTQAHSAVLREEDLFVLCDNARVYRFDYAGNPLWETKVDIYNTFAASVKNASPDEITWDFTADNKLIVNALGVATVIDCEKWGNCAGFAGYVGYCPEDNVVILESRESLSACRRYSTEELLELGREQLNGFALSEEERRYYGLN